MHVGGLVVAKPEWKNLLLLNFNCTFHTFVDYSWAFSIRAEMLTPIAEMRSLYINQLCQSPDFETSHRRVTKLSHVCVRNEVSNNTIINGPITVIFRASNKRPVSKRRSISSIRTTPEPKSEDAMFFLGPDLQSTLIRREKHIL